MYEKNVFINCPFDAEYVDLLQAITFAVVYAGFIPRSALEEVNSGEERLAKIVKLIREASLSLHDISRVEMPPQPEGAKPALPRFNMPFECGIFYGAYAIGVGKQKEKKFLVLDSQQYRYQQTMSDIAGKDPACHNNDPNEAIRCVRRFLSGKNGNNQLPGDAHFIAEYQKFRDELPAIVGQMKMTVDEIRQLSYWKDYVTIVTGWVKARASAG
jgi:hypothetical protein